MMADHKSVTRMLKTARGQIDGILRMVDEDRYCVDISTQLMATQALLARINADFFAPAWCSGDRYVCTTLVQINLSPLL